MTEAALHRGLALGMIATAVAVFAALRITTAPYGRHVRAGWGPTMPARLGWIVMEAPAAVAFLAIYALGDRALGLAPLVLLVLWQLHYVHRAFVFPFGMRGDKRMPIAVAGMAIGFNLVNAYLNARQVSAFGDYPAGWLLDPRFPAGAALFLGGRAINRRADRILLELRATGDYQIPRGMLFRWVSCPNYLGEIIEWIGWAVATWSLAGLAFAAFTFANLAPRALSHHRWYRERFANYPPERRALIPFLW